MTSMSLSGQLPKGDGNGLAAAYTQFLKDPHEKRIVIGIVDVAKITRNVETEDEIPQAKFRRIEVIGDDDKDLARRLLDRAFEARTGETALPFELEADVREIFDGAGPDELDALRREMEAAGDDGDIGGEGDAGLVASSVEPTDEEVAAEEAAEQGKRGGRRRTQRRDSN